MYPGPVPEIPLTRQLEECANSLSATVDKMEEYIMDMMYLMERMAEKSKNAKSEEYLDARGKTRDMVDTVRQTRGICVKTVMNMKGSTSVIDNFANAGKSAQNLSSTTNQPFNGRNRGPGQINLQFGVVGDSPAVQKLSGDMATISGHWRTNGDSTSLPGTIPPLAEVTMDCTVISEFKENLDPEFNQNPGPVDDTAASSAGANESRTRSSKKKLKH
jgi:hypothetical protein